MQWRIVLDEEQLRTLVGGSRLDLTLRPKTREAAVTLEIVLADIGLGRIEEVVQEERARAHSQGLGD